MYHVAHHARSTVGSATPATVLFLHETLERGLLVPHLLDALRRFLEAAFDVIEFILVRLHQRGEGIAMRGIARNPREPAGEPALFVVAQARQELRHMGLQ